MEPVAGNAQKANALSANHCPSILEGNACKCQRLRHIAPTRPSVKCQRCVVGINLGFGDGRGGTHVPLSTSRSGITYRSLLDLFSCRTPLFLCTSGSNDLRRSLHLCGLSYRAFSGLGSQAPNWKHFLEPPVSRATLKCNTPASVCILSLC